MKLSLDVARKLLPAPAKDFIKRLLKFRNTKAFKPYIKKKTVEGVKFNFWIGDSAGQTWYDLESTDPVWLEMRFIRDNLISEGDSILECGGHHGCTAIILSKWVGPAGKVVTFEPLPANCKIIEKNIRLNHLTNVTLERKALGPNQQTIFITNSSNASVSTSDKGVKVDQTCLDDYAYLNPTFIKIDVEGFEKQVLLGAQKILATCPKLAIEIHTEDIHKYGASLSDIFRLIHVENYKIWIQWQNDQSPEEYDMKTPIAKRIHLFCIPIISIANNKSPVSRPLY